MFEKHLILRKGSALVWVLIGALAGTAFGASEGDGWRTASGALADRPASDVIQVRTVPGGDGTQQLVYRFPAPDLVRLPDGSIDVRIASAEYLARAGEPVLPLVAARVAIPQGHEVVQVDVVPGAARQYVLDAPVRHAREPYPLSRPQDRRDTPRKADLYAADAPYPGQASSPYSIQTKRGVAFVDLVLYPVAYRPQSGVLTAYEELTVQVVTRAKTTVKRTAETAAGAWRARFRSATDAVAVSSLLDNPETAATYTAEPLEVSGSSPDLGGGLVKPLDVSGGPVTLDDGGVALPCRASDHFEHVIITSESIRDSFWPWNFNTIVGLRQAQGLSSTIVTVEAITAAYPGSDAAVQVRTFIRDAYDKWGTEYVLLGGDSEVVPMRMLYAVAGGEQDHIPSDLYFQCLDGSFDSDGDGIWGESTDGADRMDGRPGTDIDLYAEVAIGRVPVASDYELMQWVLKQQQYEMDRLAAVAPYLRGALIIGEHLGFGGVSEYATASMEEIRLGADTHGYRTAGFAALNIHTNTTTLYDAPAANWENTALANLINTDRYSLMNHLGHCNTTYCMKFTIPEVYGQWNNQNPGFLYTQGCYPGAFDMECIAETLTVGTENGLFGGVFNSRYGWGAYNTTDGPSQRFNRWFWHVFFGELTPVIGFLNQQSHERNAARINESCMRWITYESNLFGDPAQWLYGIAPEISLDREAYRSDAAATVEVVWPMVDMALREVTVELMVTNAAGIVAQTNVVCNRYGALTATGRFVSDPVPLANLGATNGYMVVARWEQPPSAIQVFYDSAPVDDIPPVILNLHVVEAEETSLTIGWNTDELAIGGARVGLLLPPPVGWVEADYNTFTTNHQARFDGLEPFARYYVAVWAEDLAGNTTNSPADSVSTDTNTYFSAATVGREAVARFDFERSGEGWSATNINAVACWQYGTPETYGPLGASRCWGTVLNGRYPNGANATLTSPEFTVRRAPLITFQHWLDVQYSMDFINDVMPQPVPYGDYGQIEVLASGVWHNVTPYADISGGATILNRSSSGWRRVRVALPPAFAHQVLSVRFRFVSDQQSFLDGNPAGWYVDDLVISDVPDSGLGISMCDISDSGVGLVGDGDGLAEPGETVSLRPRMFNYGTGTVYGLTGSYVVLVAGNPSEHAVLIDGSPAAVSYGNVAPGQEVPAQGTARLQLSPLLPSGTVITLLQTLTDAAGNVIESRYDLVISSFVTLAGTVIDITTTDPIPAATVMAERGDARLMAVTDANGDFLLTGAISNGFYRVTAMKAGAYSSSNLVVQAPASGLLIALGHATGYVSPSNLVFDAAVGGWDLELLTVSNAVDSSAVLHVTPQGIDYQDGYGWLSLSQEPFTLAPGQALALPVTASAQQLQVGVYRATVIVALDDPLQPEFEIPAVFTVAQSPLLDFGGFVIDGDTDDDRRIEAGETGDMFIYLSNTNGMSAAFDVRGVLTPLDPRVTLTNTGDLAWDYIPASGSRLSDTGVGLALDPGIGEGEELQFRLDVTFDDVTTNTFFFPLVHGSYHVVTGLVQYIPWSQNPATIATNPVAGATVVATATNGTQYTSLPTDTNGLYRISGVPIGNTWFTVNPPQTNYPYVAPAGTNVLVDLDPMEINFMLGDYGTNAPHLLLYDVSVDDSVYGDGDGAIDPGERLVVRVRIYNDGMVFASAVTGMLSVADMGVGVGPFMTVADGFSIGNPTTINPSRPQQNIYYLMALDGFEVDVDPAAVKGDLQRFWMTAADAFNPVRAWPFDFALTVDPLYAISGTVTFALPADHTPANLARIRVIATYGGETYMQVPSADGSYVFAGIPDGAQVTVTVRAFAGFTIDAPASYTFDPLSADQAGVDFVLSQSLFTVSPERLDETIWEGFSATNALTLSNGSASPITVGLSASYNRGPYDVVTPDGTLANLLAENAVDWTRLDPDVYASGELDVRFKDGTGWMERQAILKQYGLRALFHFKMLPACVAVPQATTTGPAEVAALAQALATDSRILYVQPAAKVEPYALPNDPLFDQLYGLVNNRQTGGTQGADINVQEVWDVTTGSPDIIVAVCDTGVEWTHDDLLANVWWNPLDGPGDVNGDGYPGARGVDDDGDAESQLYFFNPATNTRQGPEVVDPQFDPEMWRDDYSLVWQPGVPLGGYVWQQVPNDIPDFFEPYLLGLADVGLLLSDSRFADSNGDGTPDIFADADGDGIPDIFADEDGDGIINETGIDFRDEDVMLADYNLNGRPLCTQKFVMLPWPGGGQQFRVLVEQWDHTPIWNGTLTAMELAAMDDDENGYADDINGWNFYDWDSDVLNTDMMSGHGTHVAGTIGAVGDNGIGVAGVNWQVKIMPLALTSRGKFVRFTTAARIAKAMEYALDQGVQVSNHSWGGAAGAGILYEVMKLAERDYNHLFVVSAGNSAQDLDNTRIYPAYYSTVLNNVITVAASDHDGQLASFTCWGKDSVQIAAPGVGILSTLPENLMPGLEDGVAVLGGTYGSYNGTSMAAPHVAGAAALLWSHAPQARYEAIKRALLEGSRYDPNFEGWVKSAGHLDVGRAFRALGREWLALSTNQVTIPAGGSAVVQVYFNPDRNVASGFYEAEILANSTIGDRIVPVTLTVNELPLAVVKAVRVTADSDGDGFAEPGETVDFYVSLRNTGSGTFVGLQGVLTAVTPGVGVPIASAAWDYLYGGSVGESLTAYRVTLPPGAPAEVLFDLALTADGAFPQTVRVVLPAVPRYAIAGRVVTTGGSGVAGAAVECWGAAGGRAVTDGAGYYKIFGLISGSYSVRAIPTAHARSLTQVVPVSGADAAAANLVVGAPVVSLSTNLLASAVQQGFSSQMSLTVSNAAADSFAFAVEVMPRSRIGLFSDGGTLGNLVAPLRRMGFEVDRYTNNFAVVHYVNPSNAVEIVLQQVRYTGDDEKVFQYDFVIADLTGSNGVGRVFSAGELSVFSNYVARGGKVLFTGANPLTHPDNEGLSALCGVAMTNRAATATNEAVAAVNWNGAFASVALGDRLAVTNWIYDLAASEGAETLFTAGDANKLTRLVVDAERGGTAYLWTGNPFDSDWRNEGLWLDILRDILRNEFLEPAAMQVAVPWLQVTPVNGNLSNSGVALSLALNGDALLEPGTYRAVVALLGRDRGEEIVGVPVQLTVAPPTLRAFTSGQVRDWRNLPLLGDGGASSAIYQVLYAGPDGVPQPPAITTGAPTGDDLLLAVFPSGEAFGRFGAGVTADSGRFNQRFSYPFPFGTSNAVVYVRAWDGPSFNASLAYGDSAVRHTVVYTADEAADFGSWQVTNVVNYLRDSNGDTIPDGWTMAFRPDLDPREGYGPIPAAYQALSAQPVRKNLTSDPAPRPYRVVVSKPSGKFVFALDQANSRIAIIQTNNPTAQVLFGSAGNGQGQFSTPEGLAADPRAGHYRLAVADTSNHRVQLFTYDPVSGDLTFERAFGTQGSGTGNLNRPASVAFDTTGRLFVADKVNNRIAIFRVSDGAWLGSFAGGGSYVLSAPQGVCVDSDLDGGVWVCDTANNRVTLYTTAGVFKRSIGVIGSGNGQFQSPVDVQIWRVGLNKRLLVVDKSNNRVQLFTVTGTHRLNIGTGGTLFGQLSLPHGVFPITDQPVLCVADTANSRIQWFGVTLDADLDGMEDFWEDLHLCLSSAIYDADADPDGDGVSNLGEFLLGTDPCNPDTNGNGGSDGWELANGRDPLKPSAMVDPPGIASLTADPLVADVGETVTVTLVYDMPVAVSSPVALELSGGATAVLAMVRQDAVTYTRDYIVQAGDSGDVDAAVSGGLSTNVPSYTQDPVVHTTNALFEVVSAEPAVVTEITASTNSAAAGDAVTLTVAFSKPVTDGSPQLSLSGAATLAATAMTKVNSTNYTYVYVVPGSAASGVVAAQVSGAIDAATLLPVAVADNPAAFSIYFPSFAITAFGGDPLQLAWQAVVGGVYDIETNASLLNPFWGVYTNVTADNAPEESVPIAPELPSLFYRVKRVNP